MVRDHVLKKISSIIVSCTILFHLMGCSSEYGTIGPVYEGSSSISGGAMLLLAGMPGGIGTSDGVGEIARFNSPRSSIVYGDILYVADKTNHTIRKIDIPARTVSTIAGLAGRSGLDDGIGSRARFSFPEGIETDGEYLYIADTGNHAIRKIDVGTGKVVTLAGRRGQAGVRDGTGKDALFRGPSGLVLIDEFLYVADSDNHTIRRTNKFSGETITVAGTANKKGATDGIGTSAQFNIPLDITTDGTFLYIADTFNHTIRRLDMQTGEVTTLAGLVGVSGFQDGPFSDARFYYPYGLAARNNMLYVADIWNEVIRAIDLASGIVSTIAGTLPINDPSTGLNTFPGSADGGIGVGRFYGPSSVSSIGDYLYITDMDNHSIRRVDVITGEVITIAGRSPNFGSIDAAGDLSRFSTPGGIALEGESLYVADTFNHTIREIDVATGSVTTLAGSPGVSGTADSTESPALFNSPTDVIIDETGENLYIIDTVNHVIRKMNMTSGEIRSFSGSPGIPGKADGTGTAARFNSPKRGLRIGDNIYITDTGNHAIRKLEITSGTVTTLAGEIGIAGWTDTGESSGPARFNGPGALTTDGTVLYIADTGNHAIRKVDLATGDVVTVAGARGKSGLVDSVNGSPLFKSPEGVVWNNGLLYIADTGNHVLRKVDLSSGEVSFVAGDMDCIEESETESGETRTNVKCTGQPLGTSVYTDSTDGTGKTAAFNGLTEINTDGTFLYVMDSASNSIRRVQIDTGETKTFSYSKNKGISLNVPSGGDISGSMMYLADKGNNIIRKLDITSLSRAPLIIIAGTVGVPGYRYSAGYSAQFNRPVGITSDGQGNLYIADTANHTIRKIDLSTKEVTTVAGIPSRPGFQNSEFGYPLFNFPRGICIVGDVLYVADSGNHAIRRVNLASGNVGLVAGLVDYVTNTGSAGTSDSTGAAAGFNDPRGIISDGKYLYVTDTGNNTIRRILRATGQVKTIAGLPRVSGYWDGVGFEALFSYPRGIAVDGDYLYVADTGNNVFRRVNKITGEVLTFSGKKGQASFISGAREDARYNNVVSIATSPDTPYLFFTDSMENVVGRIEK